MAKASWDQTTPSSPSDRVSELREALLRLDTAMLERLRALGLAEKDIIERVMKGQLSMDARRVDGYKLADGMLARSMRLSVRINQRNLLYFTIRRRQLRRSLAALGVDVDALEREWLAQTA